MASNILYSSSKVIDGIPTVTMILEAKAYVGWVALLEKANIKCEYTVKLMRCDRHTHENAVEIKDLFECINSESVKYFVAVITFKNAWALFSYEKVARHMPKVLLNQVDNSRLIMQKGKYIPICHGNGWQN